MTPAEEGTETAAPVPLGTESWPVIGARAARGVAGASLPKLPEGGELLGGRFFLRRLLGAGATGVVFEALDHVSRQEVAIKVLRPGAVLGNGLERLRREVRLSRPGHPGIVRLNDLHEADGLLLLSMELVEGRSLQAHFTVEQPLEVEVVVALGRQLAGALAFLHGNGLVHRDVKPGNILLTADGAAKLCDLGLVRPVDHGLTVTMSEAVVGTPAYMAPEQAAGRELTGATDVYALGLTLWQALTGRVPMTGMTAVETMTRRQREQPPRLRPLRPDCPRWLERLLRRMLAPRPEDRPAAAAVGAAFGVLHFRPLPKTRTLGAVAFALLVILGLALAGRAILVRPTVRLEKEGTVVRGVDERGRLTWMRTFESPVQQMLEVDLEGDGRKDLVVSAWGSSQPVGRIDRLPYSEVAVLRTDGSVVTRIRPEEFVGTWTHPFPRRFQPRAVGLDIDHDGRSELVILCPHWAFYPTELLVFWPKTRTWDRVLDHWGRIYEVASVPGPAARIRFLGRNNAYGLSHVLGELELTPPGERASDRHSGAMLTTTPGLACADPSASWVAYSLFEPRSDEVSKPVFTQLEVLADGGTLLRLQSGTLAFDSNGNPVSGPNGGRDLRSLRLEFAAQDTTQRWSSLVEKGENSTLQMMEKLRRRFEVLLSEPQYRLTFDLLFARQLAFSRAPARAAALLRGTVADVPGEEAPYQLATFLALAGDLDSAAKLLRGLTRNPRDLRGTFDAPQLLVRVGAEAGNEKDVALAIEALSLLGNSPLLQPTMAAALRARANVVMDRVGEPDAEVRSSSHAPDGDAIAVLARWRLGRTRPEDVKAMEAFVEGATDAEVDGRLALATAWLGSGRSAEAVALCDEVARRIEPEARTSFERGQQLLLARAIQAKSLLAVGNVEAARQRALGVVEKSRPGLLWSNLAKEVLSRADRRVQERR